MKMIIKQSLNFVKTIRQQAGEKSKNIQCIYTCVLATFLGRRWDRRLIGLLVRLRLLWRGHRALAAACLDVGDGALQRARQVDVEERAVETVDGDATGRLRRQAAAAVTGTGARMW